MTAHPEAPSLISLARSEPTTAVAMVAMLRRHYVPDESRPAGIFAPEVQAPGLTRRTADLIWLGCTAATGKLLIGHEIKVSRADLLAELADLTKTDPWQRYCDRWYLVVPSVSLIEGLELPGSWGVMLPPSGRRTRSMTVNRPAPPLRPDEQSPALRTIAAWVHWRVRDARNRADDREDRLKRALDDIRELQLKAAPRTHNPTREIVERIVVELGGATGISPGHVGDWQHRVKVDDVVAALKDLGAVYERRDDAMRTLTNAQTSLGQLHRHVAWVLDQMNGQVVT